MPNLYEHLEQLAKSDEYPFHMPGHKRQMDGVFEDISKIDITEIDGYDDLYEPEGIIADALNRAKRLYKTDKTFFLVNGSTVGILTAIFSVANAGDKVLMAKNCHKSVYHAVDIRGLKADYIVPEQQNGIFFGVKVDDIDLSKDYKAVIITSPTYEGRVSDIESISKMCHERNIPLIVDEAHGAHFGFNDRFPKSAISLGADIVIQSTHKTLEAMTQTGLLHVKSKIVDLSKVEYFLQVFQTSSPSYVLMSSIDYALSKIERYGADLWENLLAYRDHFIEETKNLKNISILETDDPCKITITVKNGVQLAKQLLKEYHLQVEMAAATYVVLIVTSNDTEEGFLRLETALKEIDNNFTDIDTVEIRDLSDLLGVEAQNNIYVYPPGIPIVVKGERIDKEAINTITAYIKAGLKIRGI